MNDSEAKAQSRLAAMRQGKRAHKDGALPADGVPFVWQVLTGTEKQECIATALARFAELGIPAELRGHQDLEDETWWQVLWRSMRDPDDPDRRPLAKNVAELRDLLSDDERDALATDYLDFEEEVNPHIAPLTEFERAAIAEALKKSDVRIGISFGSRMLWSYLRSLDNQPWT